MEYDIPVRETPIDAARLTGQPMDRVDGKIKVSGAARYAYEIREAGDAAYGFLLTAGRGKGRIPRIDTGKAEAAPGVLLVWTYKNAPAQAAPSPKTVPQLVSENIVHDGEAIAVVVAESFEQAREASFLIEVAYEAADAAYDLAANTEKAETPPEGMFKPDSGAGEFDKGFAAAPVQLDVTYTTPPQSQAMMEPHASYAHWEDDRLVIHTANQLLNAAQASIAATLQMPPEKVRVVAHYVGGGFGSKLKVFGDAILAALAARELRRPVKIALTRQQIFNHTTHRSASIQRLRLGAQRDGKLLAIAHESIVSNLPGKTFFEPVGLATTMLYAAPHRKISHRMVALDIPESASMRAPGEAVGMLALECAMDELAEQLEIDPIELRIKNEPSQNPEDGTPYSARKLIDCMREGADIFGWRERNKKPGTRREGNWLVGIGMASAVRGNLLQPSSAEVKLSQTGRLRVRTAMTDIGTGTYTILSQIAAELLGLEQGDVDVEIGDTDYPEAAGSGGSWGAASSGSSVFYACEALRTKLAAAAGFEPGAAVFENGLIRAGNKSRRIAELAGEDGITAEGKIEPGVLNDAYTQAGYGAHFAEVAVDADTGEIRVRRMLGVFAAGRILNPKTARSQAIGGMVFGIGAALTEDAVVDTRYGHFVNQDFAEYHIPVHADVPDIEAIYLPELDDKANPLKAKGVGELGISGAGAAIANAVYNACGVRIRDYPLTLDKVIAGLETQKK
jgi:xanthine dehydrogenase YagR molybdenum-binding subunit